MTSRLVSSDDQALGEEIAQKIAKSFGYEHLGRSFLTTVADTYETTERKVLKALILPPSLTALASKSMELHLAYLQTATLERLLEDSIVCEGETTAHLYVRGVSHMLTVRLLCDVRAQEERLAAEKGISTRRARREIERENNNCIRWSQKVFSLDESNASHYDMVISLAQIGLTKAVDVIKSMATYRKFKPMTYSRRCLEDLALASKLRVALLSKFSYFRVVADGGTVTVHIKCPARQKAKIAGEIKVMANEISRIKFVVVHAVSKLPPLQQ